MMRAADETAVPAGGALAVDRSRFSEFVTEKIRQSPNIEIVASEVERVPREGFAVIATGPLTEGALYDDIASFLGGQEFLHFFDAAAPLVSFDSIDMSRAFFASRYEKGADYINCPHDEGGIRAVFTKRLSAPRRPRSAALRKAWFSRAACRWRSWPREGRTRCATGR